VRFAYIGSKCTGLGRSGSEGELTGYCSSDDRVWGMVEGYYNVVNGKLVGKSESEVGRIKAAENKDSAADSTVADIESKMYEMNGMDFVYDGRTYVADDRKIQGTQNNALGRDFGERIKSFLGTANEGKWYTREGFVDYNNGEFIEFADKYFERESNNFTTRTGHMIAVEGMRADPNKTADDVLAYDYSEGWF